MKNLWEVDHPYYCNLGNYFAKSNEQTELRFRSWADFAAEFEDADTDYNLLFRWDWEEGPDHNLPKYNGDLNYRGGLLKMFYMLQRKGLYLWCIIEVCRNDQDVVREFLASRFEDLRKLWEPFDDPPEEPRKAA